MKGVVSVVNLPSNIINLTAACFDRWSQSNQTQSWKSDAGAKHSNSLRPDADVAGGTRNVVQFGRFFGSTRPIHRIHLARVQFHVRCVNHVTYFFKISFFCSSIPVQMNWLFFCEFKKVPVQVFVSVSDFCQWFCDRSWLKAPRVYQMTYKSVIRIYIPLVHKFYGKIVDFSSFNQMYMLIE